jgi:ABC-type transport system involved in multi-copper enzyme maturation permease subunit
MANPIVQRELVGILRDRRTFLALSLLSIAFALMLAVRWPTDARMAQSGSRSVEVFRLFMLGLLGAIHLLLPVFPATSLVRERNRGTLALLLNTPLGLWRIFSGKLLAVFGLAALMLSISLPAAAACYALGGISLVSGLGGCYLVLVLASLELCALSLLVSSSATTTDAAIRWAYGLILALTLATMLPHALLVGTGGPLEMAADWLRCLSPLSALLQLLGSADLTSHGMASTADVPTRFVVLSILVTVVCSAWTIRRLRFAMFDRVRSTGKVADDQSLQVRALRRVMFVVDPTRRSRAMSWLVNPVMVKEFRCRKFGRLHWLLRLVAFCAVLALAMSILTTTRTIAWDVITVGGILVVLQVALLVLITPSLSAGLICTERESGGWVLLQMTPMSAIRILWGKLLSVVLTLGLVLCATLPGYLVIVFIDPGQRAQIERVVLCLIATAAFATLSTAAIGSLFKQTALAIAASYSFLIAICTLPLLVWMGRDAPFGHDTVETALVINPIAATLSVIRFPGFRDYDLIPGHWWVIGVLSGASLVLLVAQTVRVSRPEA